MRVWLLTRPSAGEDHVEVREREAASGGAPRPAYSALDPARHARLTGRPMRGWREALRDHVEGQDR